MFNRSSSVCYPKLQPKNISKYQRSYNSSIAFNNKFRRMDIQFSPGNFFVGNCTTITTVTGCTVADLAEITPERNIVHFKILVQHRHHANREITGNTATNLEKTNAFTCSCCCDTSRLAKPCIRYRFSWCLLLVRL